MCGLYVTMLTLSLQPLGSIPIFGVNLPMFYILYISTEDSAGFTKTLPFSCVLLHVGMVSLSCLVAFLGFHPYTCTCLFENFFFVLIHFLQASGPPLKTVLIKRSPISHQTEVQVGLRESTEMMLVLGKMVVALLGAHPSFVAQNYAGRRAVYLD